MCRLAPAIAALSTLLAIAGCMPNRVVIDLAPPDDELTSTTVLTYPEDASPRAKVAIIDIEGLISYAPPTGLFRGATNSVDRVVARLNHAKSDPNIRAVVLRINSPGGTVAASEELYHEIVAFREASHKPVVAWFGEIATSGAYYVVLATDRIVAQPSSITASIGVLIQTFNFSEGMSRIGISGRTITSGDNKALTNPFEAPVESHFAILQEMVDEYHEAFRDRVAERRPALGADPPRLDALADGRVVTGRDALRHGFVDATGSLRDAFAAARELAGVDAATLALIHPAGVVARTPYATSVSTIEAPSSAMGVDPLTDFTARLAQRGLIPAGPGVYYLWLPPGAM